MSLAEVVPKTPCQIARCAVDAMPLLAYDWFCLKRNQQCSSLETPTSREKACAPNPQN